MFAGRGTRTYILSVTESIAIQSLLFLPIMKSNLLFLLLLLCAVTGQAQTATGPGMMCVGTSATYTGTPAGGTWSSSNVAIVTVATGTGVATSLTLGVATLTYTIPAGGFATLAVTVVSTPSAGVLSGTASICAGSSAAWTSTVSGGTWSSLTPSVATVSSMGLITGVASGTSTIVYTVGSSGCSATATRVVTVNPGAGITTTGPTSVCVGGSITHSGSPAGGTWAATPSSVVSVSGAGLVSGITSGVAMVTYTNTYGCTAVVSDTIISSPSAISGSSVSCIGTPQTRTCSPAGGTWSSSAPGIGAIAAATGVFTPVSAGTTTITYALPSGCYSTKVVTVAAVPTLIPTSAPVACGPGYTLGVTGGTGTYMWTPGTGLTCSSCTSPVATATTTTTYTVLDYGTLGCGATATITLSPNKVYGNITFSGTAPSAPSVRVWLIQYNPVDSSITALDSTMACTSGSALYYQFDGKPAGNYLVKARLLGTVAGTSDYVPTYGASTTAWSSAATIAHTATTADNQNINMIYGTVPSGPGFISGYVYAGAGRGTASELPEPGMIVYLRNAAGDILTCTYTDASGAYTFSGLANGSYVVYPTEYSYYTTPSAVITLSTATPSASAVGFRKYTTSGVILPWAIPTSVACVQQNNVLLYPNPATNMLYVNTALLGETVVTIQDMTGRTILTGNVAEANHAVDIAGLAKGLYMVRLMGTRTEHTAKLTVE